MDEDAMHKHVVPRKQGRWAVKTAGGEKASKVFKTRESAIMYAKDLVVKHNVCMVLHDPDSKFEGFDCADAVRTRNQHVVMKEGGWAVVTAGGKEISNIFPSKGAAMAHAYDIATKQNVCMIVHDKKGKFKSVTCGPDGTPGILEVVRMKLKR